MDILMDERDELNINRNNIEAMRDLKERERVKPSFFRKNANTTQ